MNFFTLFDETRTNYLKRFRTEVNIKLFHWFCYEVWLFFSCFVLLFITFVYVKKSLKWFANFKTAPTSTCIFSLDNCSPWIFNQVAVDLLSFRPFHAIAEFIIYSNPFHFVHSNRKKIIPNAKQIEIICKNKSKKKYTNILRSFNTASKNRLIT